MELWIRSQDKEVITKINISLIYWKDVDNSNCIVKKDSATSYSTLGVYATKERALEVLDEIQNRMKETGNLPSNIIDVSKQVFIPPFMIYEMPEE